MPITKVPGVCGGRAIFEGTRIPVWTCVELQVLSTFLEFFPHLTEKHWEEAMKYYDENREEINKDMEEDEEDYSNNYEIKSDSTCISDTKYIHSIYYLERKFWTESESWDSAYERDEHKLNQVEVNYAAENGKLWRIPLSEAAQEECKKLVKK